MQYIMSLTYEIVHRHRPGVQGDLKGPYAQHREPYDGDPHDKTAYYASFLADMYPS